MKFWKKIKIKSLRENKKKIFGKSVFLRCDFNVPVKNSKILDDYKIIACLPTIRFLLRYKCKLILATHFGQPKGKDKKYSVKPIAKYLEKILDKKVKFIDDCVGTKVKSLANNLGSGEIMLIENLRFYEEEEKNDKNFAKNLAELADVYVNNAFAASHRAHASLAQIKKYLPSYAGLLLEDEIVNLNKIINPIKPLISIFGGAKIGTKIKLIEKLSKKSEWILVGGALANNFFVAHGLEVGKSLIDKDSIKFAQKFKNKNVILPVDVVVSKKINGSAKPRVKKINELSIDDVILDIGPETIKLFSSFIKQANSIIWNGPMGMFENVHYKHGTIAIGQIIAARSRGQSFGVVGGGETIEALKMTKMIDYVDWVSTGGGAMLSYLGEEKMPGLEGII